MNTQDHLVEVTFKATTDYTVPNMDDDKEEFLKEWIKETYPEFYDVSIEELKEANK